MTAPVRQGARIGRLLLAVKAARVAFRDVQTRHVRRRGNAAKNIIIRSDGIWNSGYKRWGTNVFKLYEAVDTSDDE